MATVNWEGIASALKLFKTPPTISDGDWVIIEGIQYVYRNGEWEEKVPPDDK